MLDHRQQVAARRVDDGLEPVLVLVGFLGDESVFVQGGVRLREVRDVAGDVVAVLFGNLARRLLENQPLVAAHADLGAGAAVARRPRGRVQHFGVEPCAAVGRAVGTSTTANGIPRLVPKAGP